jgi:hypothetical protein
MTVATKEGQNEYLAAKISEGCDYSFVATVLHTHIIEVF